MDQTAKQQVAEKLRDANNVLVTVSKNPSVDEMSAAIGLNLMLNKLGKHSTTVFSGKIPDAISFLKPDNTVENNVDSLRDFIISLDKDKADKLRYKVEDDVVKIFITPYRTKISDKDLEFSQGDFNVDVIVGLGVVNKDDLDQAIMAHGRILHDASIVTINPKDKDGKLGEVNWTDENASSISEMLVSISEALEGGILDEEMSTAFLTGIVSVTDRFSNEKTTPKLMTMAAQLMAAGADQQLIANNLNMPTKSTAPKKESGRIHDPNEATIDHSKKTEKLDEKHVKDMDTALDNLEKKLQKSTDDSSKDESKAEEPILPKKEDIPEEKLEEVETKDVPLAEVEEQVKEIEQEVAKEEKSTEDTKPKADLNQEVQPHEEQEHVEKLIGKAKGESPKTSHDGNPTLGGTFNATSQEAHEKAEDEKKQGINDQVLKHKVSPVSEQLAAQEDPEHVDKARAAVEAAMNSMEFDPRNNPSQSVGAQPMPGSSVGPINQQAQTPIPPAVNELPPSPQPNQNGFAPAPNPGNMTPPPLAPPPGPPPMPGQAPTPLQPPVSGPQTPPPPAAQFPTAPQQPAPAPQPMMPQAQPQPQQAPAPNNQAPQAPPPPSGTFPLPPANNGQLPPPPPQ